MTMIQRTKSGALAGKQFGRLPFDKSDTSRIRIHEGINDLRTAITSDEWTLYNNYMAGTLKREELYREVLEGIKDLIEPGRIYTNENASKLLETDNGLIEYYVMHVDVYNKLKLCRAKERDDSEEAKELRKQAKKRKQRKIDKRRAHMSAEEIAEDKARTREAERQAALYKVKYITDDIVEITWKTIGVYAKAVTDKETLEKYIKIDRYSKTEGERRHRLSFDGRWMYLVNQGSKGKPGRLIHRIVTDAYNVGKHIHHINEKKCDFRLRNLMYVETYEHSYIDLANSRDYREWTIFNNEYTDNTKMMGFEETLKGIGLWEDYLEYYKGYLERKEL